MTDHWPAKSFRWGEANSKLQPSSFLDSHGSQQLNHSGTVGRVESVAFPRTGEMGEKWPCDSLPQDSGQKLPGSPSCPYLPLFQEESQSLLPSPVRLLTGLAYVTYMEMCKTTSMS